MNSMFETQIMEEKNMKALQIDGNKKFKLVDIDMPKAEGKNVLVKVVKTGICGSDLHFWESGDNCKGLVLGHEFFGVIEDFGDFGDDFQIGDRVTVLPFNPCDECEYCKQGMYNFCDQALSGPGLAMQGSYAEYISVRADMVRKLPDTLSDTAAAILEPAAITLRAIHKANIKYGDTVLVSGGGIIGQLAAVWAKLNGAVHVSMSEVNPHRIQAGEDSKYVDEVFNGMDEELVPKLIQSSNGGFDVFIDCVGIEQIINTGISSLKKGGKAVLVGVNFNPVSLNILNGLIKEISIEHSFGYVNEFDKCIDLFNKGDVDVEQFISKTVSLDEVPEIFERLTSKENDLVKVLIEFKN